MSRLEIQCFHIEKKSLDQTYNVKSFLARKSERKKNQEGI